MLDPRDSRLWQTATQLGLVATDRLEACWEAIPPEKRTADAIDRRLARQAVATGLLTLWQAQQILAGRQNGLRIGRYILLDQIGHGGMGRVYLARDTRLGRKVAIKVLSKERSQNPRALARFRREAKVGAQLQHENLIRVYDEGDFGGMPFLVMEYIEGRTVSQLVADQGALDPRAAAELGRQVALGLDHLHQKGLLHRDVNPSNILVDRDGTAKLTDLGLAIDLNDDEDVVTRDGATVGTFDYISPEQARNPRQIDTRSDIYSLGCTLFQMIAARVPFPAASLPEKLFAHQSATPESLATLAPGTPEGLDAVVRKMMAKQPADRYQRPGDAAKALEPFATRTTLSAPERATAQGRSLWDSATAGAPADRPGSEADIAASGAVVAAPPARESSSDPYDLFKIDLGTDGSITGSVASTPRSRTIDSGPRPVPPWIWILAPLIVLALILVAFALSNRDGEGPKPPVQKAAQSKPVRPANLFRDEPITVEFSDGTVHPAATLPDAIRVAIGKPAAVVLRNEEPIEVDAANTLPVNAPLVIRAADGARPTVRIKFTGGTSFLLIDPRSTVQLEGIDFVVSPPLSGPAPRAVFEVGGRLVLNQCTLVIPSQPVAMPAVAFSGTTASLSGCWVEGFRPAVRATLFPGAALFLQQTVLHPGTSDPEAVGCLLELTPAAGRGTGPRRVVLNRITGVGLCLARIDKAVAAMPIRCEVDSIVMIGRSLLQWSGPAAYPEGFLWSGRSNLYDLSGEAWVVSDAAASTPIPDAPDQLSTWSRGSVAEAESRAMDVRFAVEPAGTGHMPSDYRLVSIDGQHPGIDPTQVAAPPGR